jgi:LPXTG-motif cell wall-anchored protein
LESGIPDSEGTESLRSSRFSERDDAGPRAPDTREKKMDTTTLIVIVLVVLLLGGGGYFYRRRV